MALKGWEKEVFEEAVAKAKATLDELHVPRLVWRSPRQLEKLLGALGLVYLAAVPKKPKEGRLRGAA